MTAKTQLQQQQQQQQQDSEQATALMPLSEQKQINLTDNDNFNSSTNKRRKKLSSVSASTDQVITSLQVNSKKATLPARLTHKQQQQLDDDDRHHNQHWSTLQTAKSDCRATSGRVLDPSGALYHHWSMVVSLAFLYNFWSLSYRFAFREIDFDTVAFWFALDYLADLIYVLDVAINCRTGYLEDGVLQRKREKIGQHYRECTLFYLDCFCLLPLDILYLSIGFNSILRCTRLVKIYKFWSYVDRTERHTNYPNVFRTFTLVHYILVIFHWNACLFHMISKNNILDIEDLYKIDDNRCHDVLCQYLHAFYWSTLALTTIGDLPRPRTKGEYLYVIVELFFGLFLFASVLGHVANIVTNVSAARKEFQAKLDAVKTFMRMRRVSDELQNKVIRWFDYLWISQKSSDEERSVACLPDRLKAEIAIHVHLDTLKRVDIFQNTEAGFLCELVLRLKPVLFSPGDYVCRKNEVGHEMYIVSRGILEVVTDEGETVVATLKAGSYFGEISVLNVGLAGNKRTASVRSVGYSDLFCLNKQDLWDVLKNYPNAEMRIRARAEERLSKLDINPKLAALSASPEQQQQQQQQSMRATGANRRQRSHRLRPIKVAALPPQPMSCCTAEYVPSMECCTLTGATYSRSRRRATGNEELRRPAQQQQQQVSTNDGDEGATRSLDCRLLMNNNNNNNNEDDNDREDQEDQNQPLRDSHGTRSNSSRDSSLDDNQRSSGVNYQRTSNGDDRATIAGFAHSKVYETGDRWRVCCIGVANQTDAMEAVNDDHECRDSLAAHSRTRPRLSSGSLNSSTCLVGNAQFARRRCCRRLIHSECFGGTTNAVGTTSCRHGRPRKGQHRRRTRQLQPEGCHAHHCDQELSDADAVATSVMPSAQNQQHQSRYNTTVNMEDEKQQRSSFLQPYWAANHHQQQQPSTSHQHLTPLIQVPFATIATAAAAAALPGDARSYQLLQPIQLTSATPVSSVSMTQLTSGSGYLQQQQRSQTVVSSQTQTPSPIESQWLLLGCSPAMATATTSTAAVVTGSEQVAPLLSRSSQSVRTGAGHQSEHLDHNHHRHYQPPLQVELSSGFGHNVSAGNSSIELVSQRPIIDHSLQTENDEQSLPLEDQSVVVVPASTATTCRRNEASSASPQ